MLQTEIDMVDTLGDLEITNEMMKTPEDLSRQAELISLLDQIFNQLGLDELEPLKKETSEFKMIRDYLVNVRLKSGLALPA